MGYTKDVIKKLSSKVMCQNKWMKVREDAVEYADGTRGIYGVLEKDDWVIIMPFDGTHFHMVRVYRYPTGKYSWEFPAGTHEGGANFDAEKIAREELKEETGMIAKQWEKIGALYQNPGTSPAMFHIFIARDFTAGEKSRESSEYDMQMKKIARDELEEMLKSGGITDSPTVAAYGLFKLKYPPL